MLSAHQGSTGIQQYSTQGSKELTELLINGTDTELEAIEVVKDMIPAPQRFTILGMNSKQILSNQ